MTLSQRCEYHLKPLFPSLYAQVLISNPVAMCHRISAGADVNDYLLGLGAQKGKTPTNGGLKILSLGQGQGPIAERLMVSGRCVERNKSRGGGVLSY